MEECITLVIESVFKCFVDSAALHLGYVWNCKSKFENLKGQLENLQQRRNLMQSRVEQAENNGDDIEEEVAKWLDRVSTEIDNVTQIINDYGGAEMKCLMSLCPNVKKRYQHGKKAVKKAQDVIKLLEEENFDQISYPSRLQETWLSSADYEELESRTSILTDVMDALNLPEVTMVGIHGMGGVGKTTLARKVCEKAHKNKLFEYVVFAEVSLQPDDEKIRQIQGLIAGSLGMNLDNYDSLERAIRLRERLKKGNKILLILDNLWESLEWDKIGIPLKDDNLKECKMLFTARDVNVLRTMDCGTNFPIATLNDQETWDLFKKTAGSCVAKPDLGAIPSDVAKKCGGLPIAIVTIAKALRNRPLSYWENALFELQRPSPEYKQDSVAHEAYSCIEFSFNTLKSDMLESIFLLCCTMASTSNGSIADLLRYSLGLNLFSEIRTVDEANMRLNNSIRRLKDSSLLLETSKAGVFSIHDVVCDVGRKIASKSEKYLIAGDVRELRQNKHFKNFTSIFLVDIPEVPKKLDCPHLTFLYIRTKTKLVMSHEFFEGMRELEVVKLEGMDLSELPTSLLALAKLRALILKSCSLGDISTIGNMTTIEILDLCDSKSEEKILPEEIGNLNELRLLDVRRSSFLVPPNIIPTLNQLEELYTEDWYHKRQVGSSDARLQVSEDQTKLTTLHTCVAEAEALQNSIVFSKLKRYRLLVGDKQAIQRRHWYARALNTVVLVSDTNNCSEDGLIKQLKDIEALVLDGKQAINNILCQLDGEGFPKLKHLAIANNPNIECVVKSMSTPAGDAFPCLETLRLTHLVNLEKICPVLIGTKSFCQLTRIEISGCHQLKNLLPLSIAKQLSLLEYIRVEDCNNIEEIFSAENGENGPVSLQQLPALTLKNLPKLKTICTGMEAASTSNASRFREIALNDQLDSLSLFGEKVVFPNLKNLYLEDINFKSIWPNQFCFWVQNLTTMDIDNCSNLKYVFPSSASSSFQHLKYLMINGCEALEELVPMDEKCSTCVEFPSLQSLYINRCSGLKTSIFHDKVLYPNLQRIGLFDMENLRWIWHPKIISSGDYMPKLLEVEICYCTSLEHIFPISMAGNLLLLQTLFIYNCAVKETIGGEGAAMIFPSLKYLKMEDCHNLEFIFDDKGSFPNLYAIELVSLTKLKKIWKSKIIANAESMTKLSKVEIRFCENLEYIFPTFLVRNLSQLEVLDLNNCGVKEIVAGEGVKGAVVKLSFPELSCLSLFNLKQLRCFYGSEHKLEFPTLKELEVVQCDKIDDLFSSLKQDANDPTLQESETFSHLEKMQLVESQLGSIGSRLVSQFVNYFHRLKYLEVLGVRSDALLHSVLEKFHFLEELNVNQCSNREIFPSISAVLKEVPPSSSFKNLKVLNVFDCDEMMSLMSASTAKSLVVLEEMSIYCCNKIKHIIKGGEDVKDEITFSRLKSLKLEKLINLISFYDGKCPFNFPLFEKLEVVECPNFMFFSSGAFNMPNFQQLELEKDYSRESHECKDHEINKLIGSNSISSLLNQSFSSWSQLKLVQKFFPEHIKDLSKLEQLNLNGNEIEICQNQLSEFIFHELKCLCVSYDESIIFPNKIFGRLKYGDKLERLQSIIFPNKIFGRLKYGDKLERLELKNCSYVEIFSYKEMENSLFPPQIKFLSLESLDDLKRIWRRDYKLELLQNFESLDIKYCHRLNDVLPPPMSFGNLKIIKVIGCKGLVSLMVASTARSLEQLEELEIERCRKMRQVVTDEEADGAKDKKITFPKLKKLKLDDLYFLTSFVDGNCPLEFPVLDTLSIEECPCMDIFTLGRLSTPQLRKVYQDWKDYTCKDNLGEIILQHHIEKIFFREKLAFKNIKSLLQTKEVGMEQVFSRLNKVSFRRDEIRWFLLQSQFPQQEVFPWLQCLDVYEDDSTSGFPLAILDRFHTVERLELNSNSYEEIFSSQDLEKYAKLFAQIKKLSLYGLNNLKQMWKSDSLLQNNIETLKVESCGSLETLMPPSSSFRNLTKLKVEGCDGLINLFSPTFVKSLENLYDLKIRNCKMMEEVLSSGEEVVIDGEIIFSQLENLELYNLSSLTSFCSQNYTFSFPYLHEFTLKKCPKMKYFSSEVLNMPRLYGIRCNGTMLDLHDNLNTIIHEIHEKQNVGTSSQDCSGPSTLPSSTI